MKIIRNSLIVSLLVVLVLPTSFAFAAGIEDVNSGNYAHCPEIELVQADSLSNSGDDFYDSAASLSSSEVDHEVSFPWEVAISFPCAEASAEINSFSANPELSVAQFTTDVSPVSAETNTLSANPLSWWTPQIYADVSPVSADFNSFSANPELSVAQRYAVAAPVSAEINTLSANPLSWWTPQIYADVSPVSAETKDCYADCYDNY